MVPQRPHHLDVAPAHALEQHQGVQRAVRGPLFLQGAQRLAQEVRRLDHRVDDRRRRTDTKAHQHALPAFRQRQREAHLLVHGQAQVLQRPQRLGELERGAEYSFSSADPAASDRTTTEAPLELLEDAQVFRHVLGRGRLAVEAASRFVLHVADEQTASFEWAEDVFERVRHAIRPGRDHAPGDLLDALDVDRVLEGRGVEVEQQQRPGAAVRQRGERDRAEFGRQRVAELLLDAVRRPQNGEGDRHRVVLRPLPRRHGDLVVARHFDHRFDDRLQLVGAGVEQLALRQAVEDGAHLAVDVRVRHRVDERVQPGQLLAQERDVQRPAGERALGEAPEDQRRPRPGAVRAPLAHDDVVDRLEVMDRRRVVAVVDVDDAVVGRGRPHVRVLLLEKSREHHRHEVGVPEDAERRVAIGLGHAIRSRRVLQQAEQDVVVGQQPVEEFARHIRVRRAPAPAAQRRRQSPRRRHHLREVLDRQRHALEDRVDLMFDAPLPLPRFDALDAELAIQFQRPIVVRAAEPDDALPLPADGEERMDGGEDAQSLLLEVVFQALEDERGVGRMGFDDRDLVGAAVDRPLEDFLVARGIVHGDVKAGEALVELERRRDGMGDELEALPDAPGQRRRRQPQRQRVRHGGEDQRRELAEPFAVARRRAAGEDALDLVEYGAAPLRVRGDHGIPPGKVRRTIPPSLPPDPTITMAE